MKLLTFFLSRQIVLFWTFHINEIIYVVFVTDFFPLAYVLKGHSCWPCINTVLYFFFFSVLYFFNCWIIFSCWMYHISFIHQSSDRHFGYFHILESWIIILYIYFAQVFLRTYVLIYLGLYLGEEFLGHLVTMFTF